jgi:hypothetical protein
VSRGVVLWPDPATDGAIRSIWDELAAADLPSLATYSHRRHRPHASLIVAEALSPREVAKATGAVPPKPIPLDCSAVGVFPGSGHSDGGLVLFLSVTPNEQLLTEQARVSSAIEPLLTGTWPYFAPGGWTPHITLAFGVAAEQLNLAIPIVHAHLPPTGRCETGGIEDGDTGERWPLSATAD